MMVGRDLGDLFPPRPNDASRARAGAAHRRRCGRRAGCGMSRSSSGPARSSRSPAWSAPDVRNWRSACSARCRSRAGTVHLGGQRFTSMSPARAIGLGMGLVTEDRKSQGLAMLLDIAANITGPALAEVTRRGLIDRRQEAAIAAREIERYRIACRGPRRRSRRCPVATSRRSSSRAGRGSAARVLILDEPTRGVDVGRQGGNLSYHARACRIAVLRS